MYPPLTAAGNLLPSADEAAAYQLALLSPPKGPDQVSPESIEVKIPPPVLLATATSRLPSADEAMARQLSGDALLGVQGDLVKLEKFPMMNWPAFCETRQPLAPAPEMRTMSPALGEAGNVTVTSCELVKR